MDPDATDSSELYLLQTDVSLRNKAHQGPQNNTNGTYPEDPVLRDYVNDGNIDVPNDLYNGNSTLLRETQIDVPNPTVNGTEMSAERRQQLQDDAEQEQSMFDQLSTRANNTLDMFSDSNAFEESIDGRLALPLDPNVVPDAINVSQFNHTQMDLYGDWAWPESTGVSGINSPEEKSAVWGLVKGLLDDAAGAANDSSDALLMVKSYLRLHKSQHKSKHRKAHRQDIIKRAREISKNAHMAKARQIAKKAHPKAH